MKSILILLILGVFCGGCYESKVDQFRLELIRKQLLAIENLQYELNVNISALASLVEALNSNKYIVTVTETLRGYEFGMNDGSIIRIYHGEKGMKGEDGELKVPLISVRDSSDGHVYWTMDGRFVRDGAGNCMRADGIKGATGDKGEQGGQGAPGGIPRMQIDMVSGMWEISSDNGKTWELTGVKASGKKGEIGDTGPDGPDGPTGEKGEWGGGILAPHGVEVQNGYVEFTLQDNKKIRLPRILPWRLVFPGGMDYEMRTGEAKQIPFVISGFGGTPSIYAVGDNGWLAEAGPVDEQAGEGFIGVVSPACESVATVLVLLTNGEGKCTTYFLHVVSR